MGNLYFDQKAEGGRGDIRAVLAGRKNALGPNHTSTLDTVNNLGILCKCQGKLKEVVEMYERTLVVYEKALGPDHSRMQQVMERLKTIRRAD